MPGHAPPVQHGAFGLFKYVPVLDFALLMAAGSTALAGQATYHEWNDIAAA